MISPMQALLARKLLKLLQQDVGNHLGTSHVTISKIEQGAIDPPASRLRQLQEFYESRGVEFLEGNGVRERQRYTRRFEGVDGFRAFMDDVYETAREYGGDICLFNSKPGMWHRWLGEEWYAMHSRRMSELGDHIRVRIIVQKGESNFILNFAEHRWCSRMDWREKVFYAYGPKLAFLDFSKDDVQILVLEQSDFAESFRLLFDIAWEHETLPAEAED